MRNLLILLAAPILSALASTQTVTRYSASVPSGSSVTMERNGVQLVVLSAADQGGTQEMVALDQSQDAVTEWRSGGIVHKVITTRRDNEAGANGARTWARRHKEAVAAQVELWPPDPAPTGG